MNSHWCRIIVAGIGIFLPWLLSAQTVATLPLAKSAFCVGEWVTVSYTVTGTFVQGNIFRVQLSDPTGSFQTGFRNLNTVTLTSSGSFQFPIPSDVQDGTQYRFRVIASNPVTTGSDNGTDLTISRVVTPSITFDAVPGGIFLLGTPLTAHGTAGANATYEWAFGPDALPSTSNQQDPPPVSFPTPGVKTITLKATTPGGCSNTVSRSITVLSTIIAPSAKVVIVRPDTIIGQIGENDIDVWVCPGASLSAIDHSINRVFVERGGSIDYLSGGAPFVYLKEGASYNVYSSSNGIVLYENGASVIKTDGASLRSAQVPSLTFDYSNVPANGCPSLAPYTVQIKQNSNSIHTAQNEEKSDAQYWVHTGGNLRSVGNGNTYCVESGGEVTINGSGNKIYVKDGSKVNVQSGEGNRIFYESQAMIVNGGVDAIMLPSSGITFVSEVSSGVVEANAGESQLTISPNPVNTLMRLSVDPSAGMMKEVIFFNELGEKIFEKRDVKAYTLELPVTDFSSGLYHVRVKTERTELTRKFVKQ